MLFLGGKTTANITECNKPLKLLPYIVYYKKVYKFCKKECKMEYIFLIMISYNNHYCSESFDYDLRPF